MATFQRFEDIEAWQIGRKLTRAIYAVSRQKTFARDWALRDQIRKAAISITSNVAEGFERDSDREFAHFLSIAKGSVGEVRSQLYVALDEGYIDQATFDDLYQLATGISRRIAGLRRYLKRGNH
jgi:four helix bundle protein